MNRLSELREEYCQGELRKADMPAEPLQQFSDWLQTAIDANLCEANAMTLATASPHGKPSARVVLLKEVNELGFVFFTNYLSRKGNELSANPFAAAVFDWHEIERQVRIEGRVEKLSSKDSDTYFDSRPETSKIGAWTSPQSKILKSRAQLDDLQRQTEQKFASKPIHRPDHWGGFVIIPSNIEFWQGRASRLHDRIVYVKADNGWNVQRLAP